jgi:hypothetical protein
MPPEIHLPESAYVPTMLCTKRTVLVPSGANKVLPYSRYSTPPCGKWSMGTRQGLLACLTGSLLSPCELRRDLVNSTTIGFCP